MATNFPTSVDVLTNPVSNDSLNSPSHSAQHANANDAIEAVEDYLLNGAGKSGLVFVKSQAIGTSVSSVTVSNAFSSTYDNYLIQVVGGVGSVSSNGRITLGSTSTGYYQAGQYVAYTSATVVGFNTNNGSGWGNAISIQTNNIIGEFKLFGPNLAKTTGFSASGPEPLTSGVSLTTQGFLNDTTQYTAFTITPSSGTLTGGNIYVYGFRE